MFKIRFALATAAAFFSIGLHAEVSCHNIPQLDISKSRAVEFKGSLLRYEQQCWYLPLKAGQRLQISLGDKNGNSAMTVYTPGAKIKYGSGNPQDEDPANYYYGKTLKTTPADGQARKVNEVVKQSGNYLMVVGLALGAGSEFKGSARLK